MNYVNLILGKLNKLKSEFTYINFGKLVLKTEILFDINEDESIVPEDQPFINAYYKYYKKLGNFDKENWIIRFELNKTELIENNIDISLIQYIFDNNDKIAGLVNIIFSDINAEKVICRVKVIEKTVNPFDILEVIENEILSIKIKGIKGITSTIIDKNSRDLYLPNGSIVSYEYQQMVYNKISLSTILSDDYVIYTRGNNLIQILNNPIVDTYKTISNNIHEVYRIYGILGARQIIINEIYNVFANAGKDALNIRHIELLVDVMTCFGSLNSVNRFGAKKNQSGPIARSSFEETTQHQIQAAVFAEVDNMNGVSANVMMGQFANIGTNSHSLILDERLINGIESNNMYKKVENIILQGKTNDKKLTLDDIAF